MPVVRRTMTLRELRLRDGITIDEVAAVLTIDRAYYSRLEIGRRPLTSRQVDALLWRYGWQVEMQQPQAEMRKRRSNVSCPTVQLGTQAEFLAMMGAAVWDGEIPADWRDRWRHRGLWTQWICGAAQQVLRVGERGQAA